MIKVSKKKVMAQPTPAKKYRVLGDVVAVKVFAFKDITDGGIILPDTAKDDAAWATPVAVVVAVGPEVADVKEGDRVLIAQNTPAIKIRYDEQELLLVHAKEIAGVLDPEG